MTSHSTLILAALVLCGALASACDPATPDAPKTPLTLSQSLPGTDWALTAFGDDSETGTTTITLSFSEEEMSGASTYAGTTGGNTYWGSYQAGRNGELSVYSQTGGGDYPGVAATRAGEPEGSRLDDYILALREVDGYGFDGGDLVLTDGEQRLLRFEAR